MEQRRTQQVRPSILVVDDDSDYVCLVSRDLTEAGYDVRPAGTGGEALGIMLNDGPRIVIADWVMPGMNGIELCRRIRRHEGIAFAYIVLVTATQTGQAQLEEAFRAGVDDFLVKPVNPAELLARLQAAERICRLHEELDLRTRDACSANARLSVAYEQLALANKKLHEVAITDELTGLPNRRRIIERLEHEWKASIRRDTPLSCVVIDIDHFKAVNDTYGHVVGDAVLRSASRALRTTARGHEEIGRLGGEEFLLICPLTTAREAAVAAERLRRAIDDMQIHVNETSIHVTISLGVADRVATTQDVEALLSSADTALYAAKDAGRNAVRAISEGRITEAAH